MFSEASVSCQQKGGRLLTIDGQLLMSGLDFKTADNLILHQTAYYYYSVLNPNTTIPPTSKYMYDILFIEGFCLFNCLFAFFLFFFFHFLFFLFVFFSFFCMFVCIFCVLIDLFYLPFFFIFFYSFCCYGLFLLVFF